MKIMSVVGARPNFMKIAPFVRALKKQNSIYANRNKPLLHHTLIHTGQHYDERMSAAFFDDLGIPLADINLGIGSGTHAEQVGMTMIAFERVLREIKPDWVVVVGDVNATCACSLTAKKERIKVAHIEAGLRSRDMSMPEEINRIVTDRLSDLLFTTDDIACQNLIQEGVPMDNIRLVGNIMIDTLEANRDRAAAVTLDDIVTHNSINGARALSLLNDQFAVMTLHRPSNVDNPDVLGSIVDFLCDDLGKDMPLVWPIHPRTLKNLRDFGILQRVIKAKSIQLLHPVGYIEMLRLNMGARILLTDSGGLQEESCILGTPCITLRWNTERPVTLCEHGGVSQLAGNNVEKIKTIYDSIKNQPKTPHIPKLWDGHTAERIVECFAGLA